MREPKRSAEYNLNMERASISAWQDWSAQAYSMARIYRERGTWGSISDAKVWQCIAADESEVMRNKLFHLLNRHVETTVDPYVYDDTDYLEQPALPDLGRRYPPTLHLSEFRVRRTELH